MEQAGEETVTVEFEVVVPTAFEAVSVYVVVEAGVTPWEPEVATEPTPWLMLAPVQLVVDHESVDKPPDETVGGLAEKELMVQTGQPEVVVVTVTLAMAVPPPCGCTVKTSGVDTHLPVVSLLGPPAP
jgi:hypothetical protein